MDSVKCGDRLPPPGEARLVGWLLIVRDISSKTFIITARTLLLYFIAGSSSTKLQCYAGKKGSRYQECYQRDGFQTCFTKHENGRFDITLLGKFLKLESF